MIVKQSYFFQIDSFLNNYSKLRKVKKRFLQSFLKNIKQLKKSRNTKVNKSYVNELRKRKKSITQGIFSFNFARNNTIVTLSNLNGCVIAYFSAGLVGFKGSKKSTKYAKELIVEQLAKKSLVLGYSRLCLHFYGVRIQKRKNLKLLQKHNIKAVTITDLKNIPHNGCRPVKIRSL
jgi:small subunit ribosomal protein S11